MDLLFKTIVGYTAGAITIIAVLVYLSAIIKGKVHSNKLTWAVWSLVTLMICVYYYQTVGLVSSIWVSIAYFFGTLLTFILLLKYGGKGQWSWVEKMALTGVFITLFFRIIFNSPLIALALTMLIDAIGAIPLIVTVYKDFKNDYRLAWLLGLTSNIVNLFAVEKWDFGNAGYPIYMVALTLTVTVLLYFPNFLRTKSFRLSKVI